MFWDRYPLRISLCDSTRPIHPSSSPRRLVVGELSSVTKQQIDQIEEIFRLHPNFARARCVQLLGYMVRSILEHADENNSMKTLSQKRQPAIICINGYWPLSTRLLGLESVTFIESRGETHKGLLDPVRSRRIMLKFSLILPSNLLDRSDFTGASKLPICLILQQRQSKPEVKNLTSWQIYHKNQIIIKLRSNWY